MKALDLEELLRMLPSLEEDELLAVSAAYQGADAETRDAARAAASAAAHQHGLVDALDRLQGSIIQWAGSDIPPSAVFTFAPFQSQRLLGDLRRQAVPPLLDAAAALLLKDAISAADRATLLAPIEAAAG